MKVGEAKTNGEPRPLFTALAPHRANLTRYECLSERSAVISVYPDRIRRHLPPFTVCAYAHADTFVSRVTTIPRSTTSFPQIYQVLRSPGLDGGTSHVPGEELRCGLSLPTLRCACSLLCNQTRVYRLHEFTATIVNAMIEPKLYNR